MTARRKSDRTTLGAELKRKFKTPREALAKLGLDQTLLDVPRLALDGAKKMPKPTRLEALAVRLTARAVNPLIAFDQKVEYGPIFKGLNTTNFPKRKPTIIADLTKALKGKALAGDADIHMGHVAKMLDAIEHVAEPKSLDESVSEEQHKAMEAAAHGHSNLGIPKDVGEEFSEADKGKKFGDMLRDWAMSKDWTGGMSEDDFEHLSKMHEDCKDEMPENALDESEEEKKKREEEEKKAADKKAEDEAEAEKKKAEDKHAMDQRLKGMVTVDEMNKAIDAVAKKMSATAIETAEAREFVRPYVGELPMALDSAEKVHRAAAKALNIEDADTIHASALKTIIKTCARPAGAQVLGAFDGNPSEHQIAADAAGVKSFNDRFPSAARIQPA
jgi:hypothetical protein